jgi:alkylation response protein AidB-like acyl-CoA dehydrogenase
MASTHPPDLRAAVRALTPAIAAARPQFDTLRRLPDDLVQTLAETGVFRMVVPRSAGGLEVDPFTYLDVVEALSYADGAAGWVVGIGAGAATAVVAASVDDAVARDLFGDDPLAVLCGAIAVAGGTATRVPGGYSVSGRWPFGSGSLHSTWLASLCTVVDGAGPRMGPDGVPERRLVITPGAAATILDTWHVGGLRATGSNDYTLADVLVPEERTVLPAAPPRQTGPLYASRFYLLAHAAQALGIARRALDALAELAGAKLQARSDRLLRERALVQADVAHAEALVGSAHAYLMEVTGELWEAVTAGRVVTEAQRARGRLAMITGVRHAVQAVDLMYEAGGGTSIYESSPLERCFRDIHVAAQHAAVARPTYETVGQVLLGLSPSAPILF